MTRLPGHRYDGRRPRRLHVPAARWRACSTATPARFAAPVLARTPVRALAAAGGGYRRRDRRRRLARPAPSSSPPAPASGARRPGFRRRRCRAAIVQLDPTSYRRPGDLPAGGVLVVGGSASGLQLAQEIQRLRAAGDAGRGARTCAWSAATAAATSSPGWTPPASARERGAGRCPTSRRRGGSRRCSSRRRGRSTWRGSPPTASASPAGSRPADGGRLALGDALAAALRRLGRPASPGAGADRRAHRRRPGSTRPRDAAAWERPRTRRARPAASTSTPRASAA